MSSRIRFNAAADVFEAFPMLERFAPKPGGPIDALAYARELAGASPPSAATAYLAHLPPRREAVWWGCQCVSAYPGADEGVRFAAKWVREPDETFRREALDFALASGLKTPGSWLARAAGQSGGSLVAADQPPVPAASDACAQAVNAAVVIAATMAPPLMIAPWFKAFTEAGLRFAGGEDCRVIAPPVSRSGSPEAAPPAA